MITTDDINAINKDKIFGNRVKVKRIGVHTFEIITFHYGEEEIRGTDNAIEVAKFLNGYGGLSEHSTEEATDGCKHVNNETLPVGGGETITVCHDCGDEL